MWVWLWPHEIPELNSWPQGHPSRFLCWCHDLGLQGLTFSLQDPTLDSSLRDLGTTNVPDLMTLLYKPKPSNAWGIHPIATHEAGGAPRGPQDGFPNPQPGTGEKELSGCTETTDNFQDPGTWNNRRETQVPQILKLCQVPEIPQTPHQKNFKVDKPTHRQVERY
jgi:hypothetical protein